MPTLLSPTVITKEAMMQLKNHMVFGSLVHREYKKEFVKVGQTITIRKPVKMKSGTGADISNSINDVQEGSTTLTVDHQQHVPWVFNSVDLTMTIEEYSTRYIQPAVLELANYVDYDMFGLYDDVFHQVGTPGSTPNSFADIAAVGQRMDEYAIPAEGRNLIMNPAASWSMVDNLKGLLLPTKVKDYVVSGSLGRVADFETYKCQNVRSHTVGVNTGAPLIAKASDCGASGSVTYVTASNVANTSTLYTDGWTSDQTGILKAGDIFTIADVYGVNPRTRVSTGNPLQFVVTADADSGASTGPATLTVAPAIVTTGAYQTVTAAPADGAAITVAGTAATAHKANLAFNKNAFALVFCPLIIPQGAAWASRVSDPDTGISIRIIKDYDIKADQEIVRMDILYGTKTIYPDLAVRMAG